MISFLFVDAERVWRGGQDQLLTLLHGLILRGHTVNLVCYPGTLLEKRARAVGALVYPVAIRFQFASVGRDSNGTSPGALPSGDPRVQHSPSDPRRQPGLAVRAGSGQDCVPESQLPASEQSHHTLPVHLGHRLHRGDIRVDPRTAGCRRNTAFPDPDDIRRYRPVPLPAKNRPQSSSSGPSSCSGYGGTPEPGEGAADFWSRRLH